jgi:hypothetical protein
MIYLKKYIKYRKEDQYVLLCDCSNITNFEIPVKYWKLLNRLKKGYEPNKPMGLESEREIINDLKQLNMLSDSFDSNEDFGNSGWLYLDYTENELFKAK